jgi:hypothetical protein
MPAAVVSCWPPPHVGARVMPPHAHAGACDVRIMYVRNRDEDKAGAAL